MKKKAKVVQKQADPGAFIALAVHRDFPRGP